MDTKKTDLEKIVYEKIPATEEGRLDKAARNLRLATALVARLRGPEGCPWDRKQDHHTLRPYLIEEAYEVLDQLDEYNAEKKNFSNETSQKVKEELGDLLLQILLHSELTAERGEFDMGDVALAMTQKLVSRHPHVFGDVKVGGADDVLVNWEQLKKKEKQDKGEQASGLLSGLPKNLPSLQRAARIGEKAGRVGFDWPDWQGSMTKVDEELGELKAAIASKNQDEMENELGDLFFALCNLSRHLKIQPEDAHRRAITKFETRFNRLEKVCSERGIDMTSADLSTLDAIWDEVKKLN